MDKELIITVGVSGSGKSTWAKKWVREDPASRVWVCPDVLRGILGSDDSDQSKNYQVFQVAHTMAEYLLKTGFNVVFDATSVSVRARKTLAEIAVKTNSKLVAVVFDIPIDIAKKRNQGRDRKVPDSVIDRQSASLVKPETSEGFNQIETVCYQT